MATISFTNLKSSKAVEEYYEQEAQAATERHEQNPLASYYATPSPARWVSISNKLVQDGAAIAPGEITLALRGFAPGQTLPDGSPMPAARNAGHPDRKSATDMTASEPKGFSALIRSAELAGEHELAANLRQARAEVIQQVVRHAINIDLVRTRRGHGGTGFERPADVMVAIIPHSESRAGDPHEHDHILWMNACIREDGSVGTLDLKQLVSHKFYLQSLIGSALGERLSKMGFAAVETGRGRWELAGSIPELVQTWSKRRREVLADAASIGRKIDARNDDERASQDKGVRQDDDEIPTLGRNQTEARRRNRQNAAMRTRNDKKALPDAEGLRQKDLAELQAITVGGVKLTPERVIDAAREAALRTPVAEGKAAETAVVALFEQTSVATQRQLRTAVAEAALSRSLTVTQVEAEFQRALTGGTVLALGTTETGEPVYTTAAAMATELQMLRDARAGLNQSQLKLENIEWAIREVNTRLQAKDPNASLGADQMDAARWCARDRNCVIEGLAGTGKTTLMEVLVLAARRQGYHTIGCAPTNVAAEGLRHEANTHEGLSIQKLAAEIRRGHRRLKATDLIIVDEAGMADLSSVAPVVRAATAAGAQVLFVGDERQFAPVGAGSPFSALATVCGASRLIDIRRQRTPWQRDASLLFAGGDSVRGLAAYEIHDRWRFGKDKTDAMNTLVSDWRAHAETKPDKTRLVIAEANQNVHALNPRLRAEMLDMGRLGEKEFIVPSLHRDGRSGEVRNLAIRAGEELIIWRRVPDHNLNNGDRIKVIDVKPFTLGGGKGKEDLMVTWERVRDGLVVTAPFSSLTPPAAPDDPASQPRLPYVQHSYAVNAYQSQGKTVDHGFVFGDLGLSARGAYVALTRGRDDQCVYWDRGGIADELREEGVSPTRAAVSAFILRAATKSSDKANVADFAEDIDAWIETGDIRAKRELPDRMERIVAAREAEVIAEATAPMSERRSAPSTPFPAHQAPTAAPKPEQRPHRSPDERAAKAHEREICRKAEAEQWNERRRARQAERVMASVSRPGGPTRGSEINKTIDDRPPKVRDNLVAAARRALPALGEMVTRWAEARLAASNRRHLDQFRRWLSGLPSGRIDAMRDASIVPPREVSRPHASEQTAWQDKWLRATGAGPHHPAVPILPPRLAGTAAVVARMPRLPPGVTDRLPPDAREAVASPGLSPTPNDARTISAAAYADTLERARSDEERRVVDGIARQTGKTPEIVRSEITAALHSSRRIRRNDLRDAIERLRALTDAATEVRRVVSDGKLRPEAAVRAIDPHASPAGWRLDLRKAQRRPVDLWVPPDLKADRGVFTGEPTTVRDLLTLLQARRSALGVPAVLQAKVGSAAAVLDGAVGTLREMVREGRLTATTPVAAVPPSAPREWAKALRDAQQQHDTLYRASFTRRGTDGVAPTVASRQPSTSPVAERGGAEIRARHSASVELQRAPVPPAPSGPLAPSARVNPVQQPEAEAPSRTLRM